MLNKIYTILHLYVLPKNKSKEKKYTFLSEQEKNFQERCRTFGVPYETPAQNETYLKLKNRKQRLNWQIENPPKTYQIEENDIPHLLLLLKTTNILIIKDNGFDTSILSLTNDLFFSSLYNLS